MRGQINADEITFMGKTKAVAAQKEASRGGTHLQQPDQVGLAFFRQGKWGREVPASLFHIALNIGGLVGSAD